MAAAAAAGADAVYFGLGALDMRSLATGVFRKADLPDIAAFAKDHNLKTRLTVNAVLYDEDLSEARQTMLAAKKAGIDAVICSDVAAMMLAREVGIPVHLSTQLNIANVEALKFYAHFADVAVLARELTLEQSREPSTSKTSAGRRANASKSKFSVMGRSASHKAAAVS